MTARRDQRLCHQLPEPDVLGIPRSLPGMHTCTGPPCVTLVIEASMVWAGPSKSRPTMQASFYIYASHLVLIYVYINESTGVDSNGAHTSSRKPIPPW